MRFGLVGTGHWARVTHAPAIVAGESTTLTAVWGRDAGRTADLAAAFGAIPHTDFDRFLDDVDAVSFSVPPDVQASLALRAADRGKHLLLEKPIALDPHAAEMLAKSVESARVASLVFFTTLFRPEVREWLRQMGEQEWRVGRAVMLSPAAIEGPFATPWRAVHGGLWDVGPHALTTLSAVLGPITGVKAFGEPSEVTHLVLDHASGAVSTAALSLTTPPELAVSEIRFWGPSGEAVPPPGVTDAVGALRVALGELVAAADDDPRHPYDVRLGRTVVDVIAEAQQLLGRPRPS